MLNEQKKITASHLSRKAFLYIRQSTIRQIYENKESTERQYALQQKALELGWQKDQIIIIDNDLGISAAGQTDRIGFQKLVTEVGMGNAGLVMGLEVSRLARSNCDWHKLLEICALTETLIIDEDGLYDPKHFNDRLLLGLKGSMSEAELHIIKARLQGGLLNKAQKGELYKKLPIGYIHDPSGKIVFDPDIQVQNVIQKFFEVFREKGTAGSVTRYFREYNIKFPVQIQSGPEKGNIKWNYLTHNRTYSILHNPCYAGVYVFGRSHSAKKIDGKIEFKWNPKDQWWSFIKNAHPAYITWEDYEKNLEILKNNNNNPLQSVIREGPALLQGLVFCGICGKRMTLTYYKRKDGELTPIYNCIGLESIYRGKRCQSIHAKEIETTVSNYLLTLIKPDVLKMTLNVQQEIQRKINDVNKLLRQQVEKRVCCLSPHFFLLR